MKCIQCLRYLTHLCILLLAFNQALAQSSPSPSPPGNKSSEVRPAAQDLAPILEYATFLREEEKAHREYLEKLYTTTTVVLGLLLTVGIGLIGFFQFKTKKEVRDAVDTQFRLTVERELQARVDQFKNQLDQINQEVNQRVDGVIAEATKKFQELLFAAVPLQVESADVKESDAPDATGPLISQPTLSEEEQKILKLMDLSKYSFRSLMGIAQEAAEQGFSPDRVRGTIQSLTDRGLLGKTLGKKGGERWFITEAGRKYLMS